MSFVKQDSQPLYQDLIWMTPQRQTDEPQIVIMGGNINGLQDVMTAFNYCQNYKLTTSVVLPDSLKKVLKLGRQASNILFTPSTPAGSFAQSGLPIIMDKAQQCKCLLVAGDLSSNQETGQLISRLMLEFKGLKIVVGSIVKPLLVENAHNWQNLVLILSPSQLESLMKQIGSPKSVNLGLDSFAQLLETAKTNFHMATYRQEHLWLKFEKQICATKTLSNFNFDNNQQIQLASKIAYYLINNPIKQWQSLVSATWSADN